MFNYVNIPLETSHRSCRCVGKKPTEKKHLKKVKYVCRRELLYMDVLLILSFCVFESWSTQRVLWVWCKMQESAVHNVMNSQGIRVHNPYSFSGIAWEMHYFWRKDSCFVFYIRVDSLVAKRNCGRKRNSKNSKCKEECPTFLYHLTFSGGRIQNSSLSFNPE